MPPWRVPSIRLGLELTRSKKEDTRPEEYRAAFAQLLTSYPDHVVIYTDGSRFDGRVGHGLIMRGQVLRSALPDTCSVYTAELSAILHALKEIQLCRAHKYLLCSDSSQFRESRLYTRLIPWLLLSKTA